MFNSRSYSNRNTNNGVDLYEILLERNSIIEEDINKEDSFDNTNEYSGLYLEGSKYFFRGNVINNYLKIDGEIWRIVSFSEDGLIKIVKEESLESNKLYKYNEDYGNYNYLESNIKEVLDTWYKDNLSKYQFIVEDEYCIEYEDGCINEEKLMVSLLSQEEVIYAGGFTNTNSDSCYLNNGTEWWIISKEYDEFIGGAFSGYVNSLGSIEMGFVDEEKAIRPVITLKDVKVTGEGTEDNPYIIEQ